MNISDRSSFGSNVAFKIGIHKIFVTLRCEYFGKVRSLDPKHFVFDSGF